MSSVDAGSIEWLLADLNSRELKIKGKSIISKVKIYLNKERTSDTERVARTQDE